MKRFLVLPLIFFFVGCGGDTDEAVELELSEEQRSELYAQCDYAVSVVKNSDELLSCEVGLIDCSDQELWDIVNKWTCDTGEDPMLDGNCVEDIEGNRVPFNIDISDVCREGAEALAPLDNGWWDNLQWMVGEGKLPDSYWCGPGDLKTDTKGVMNGVDGSCRRHDHGLRYNEGGKNAYCMPVIGWPCIELPKAVCGVDRDIVQGANSQSGNGFTRDMINFVFDHNTFYPCRADNVAVQRSSTTSRSCGWRGCRTCYSTTYWTEYITTEVQDGTKSHYWHTMNNHSYADNCGSASLTAQDSCL